MKCDVNGGEDDLKCEKKMVIVLSIDSN